MTVQISKEAQTALEWAFGAYADKDPGIPYDIVRNVEVDAETPTSAEIDAMAKLLVQEAVHGGVGDRLVLGWMTFRRAGKFNLGVMALKRTSVMANG